MSSTDKIAIIIPFRDLRAEQNRSAHLRQFVKSIPDFLEKADKPYIIYCIEQSDDDRKFNRGKLLNIGFEIACSEGCNIFVFHDVDLIPSKELLPYYTTVPDSPVHVANVWNDRYSCNDSYFGGIVTFSQEDYIRINGYPNNFWGWGGEDDEMYKRVKKNNLEIVKVKKGTIKDLEEMNLKTKLTYLKTNQELKCPFKTELLDEHEGTWKRNGLNSLNYSILDREDIMPDRNLGIATKITVDVMLNGEKTDEYSSMSFIPDYNAKKK